MIFICSLNDRTKNRVALKEKPSKGFAQWTKPIHFISCGMSTPSVRSCNRFPCFNDFFGMGFILRLKKDFFDNSILIYDESGPKHPHIFPSKQFFLIPCSVFFQYSMGSIGDQWERQLIFYFKFF